MAKQIAKTDNILHFILYTFYKYIDCESFSRIFIKIIDFFYVRFRAITVRYVDQNRDTVFPKRVPCVGLRENIIHESMPCHLVVY